LHALRANAGVGEPGGRRSEVIEASASLFTERGYHETGMGDIALAVGLAKPTLYHYFRSKQDILWAIFEEISRTFSQLRAELTHLPPRERLTELIIGQIQFQAEHRVLATAFFELPKWLPPERRQAVRRNYRPFTAAIKAAYQEGVDAGQFTRSDPALFAQAVLALTSTAYRWVDPNGPLTPRQIGTLFAGYIIDGVDQATTITTK
jgi:AcrR family transcriptional regulator